MTRRLYYDAAYQTEFEATVIERQTIDGQAAVILDQTCFYPTSGGQPHDLGTLANRPVLDVMADKKNGQILHIVDGQIPDASVRGVIDW